MPSTDAIVAVHQLLGLYAHIVDDWNLARLNELYAADGVFDMSDMGFPIAQGLDGIRIFMQTLRAQRISFKGADALGHHVTNIYVADREDGNFDVDSKSFVILAGEPQSVLANVYRDIVGKTPSGWRFIRRAALRPSSIRQNALK